MLKIDSDCWCKYFSKGYGCAICVLSQFLIWKFFFYFEWVFKIKAPTLSIAMGFFWEFILLLGNVYVQFQDQSVQLPVASSPISDAQDEISSPEPEVIVAASSVNLVHGIGTYLLVKYY